MPHAFQGSVCCELSHVDRDRRFDVCHRGASSLVRAVGQFRRSRAMSAFALDGRRPIATLHTSILYLIAAIRPACRDSGVHKSAMRMILPDVPAHRRSGSRHRAQTESIRRHCLACCARRPIACSSLSQTSPTVGREDAPLQEHFPRRFWRPALRRSSRVRQTYRWSLSSRTESRGLTHRWSE